MSSISANKDKNIKIEFAAKDKVLVTYQSKWYNIVNVPGIILRANKTNGWPFHLKLQDEDGKSINLGHDNDGGQPGSGPFMYVAEEHLTLKEKFVPQRLEGVKKTDWKIGDKFLVRRGLSLEHDDFDTSTGIVAEMIDDVQGKELTVVNIITRFKTTWLIDGTINYFWHPDIIDPVEHVV